MTFKACGITAKTAGSSPMTSPSTVNSRLPGLASTRISFARAKEIRVEASPGSLEFTVDGEVIGDEPAVFAVIPQALKVIVGPGYVPDPMV